MSDFDWSDYVVCVKPQNGIAVYENNNCDAVIRIQNHLEDDDVLVLPRGHVRAVALALLALTKEAQ